MSTALSCADPPTNTLSPAARAADFAFDMATEKAVEAAEATRQDETRRVEEGEGDQWRRRADAVGRIERWLISYAKWFMTT